MLELVMKKKDMGFFPVVPPAALGMDDAQFFFCFFGGATPTFFYFSFFTHSQLQGVGTYS